MSGFSLKQKDFFEDSLPFSFVGDIHSKNSAVALHLTVETTKKPGFSPKRTEF